MAGTTHPETFVNLHCLVNGVSLNKKLTDCTPPKIRERLNICWLSSEIVSFNVWKKGT
jgi:hypothetical protein